MADTGLPRARPDLKENDGLASDPLAFDFAGERWIASIEGGLFWPRRRILLVADLHLEKASFFAAHGQPLPPYDSRETMARLLRLCARWDPAEIWCLGDSFHDPDGQSRLDAETEEHLAALAASRRWRFIAGNHDGLPDGRWGTVSCDEQVCDGLIFRHIYDPDDPRPQLSGHFHPKIRVAKSAGMAGRQAVRRPCYVRGTNGLILPAFGSFTGGMDIDDPAISGLFTEPFAAMVATSRGLACFSGPAVAKMSQG